MAARNHKHGNKMHAVREILRTSPGAKPSEISQRAKTEYGVDITPKMAGTYRYHIMGKQRRANRRAVRAAAQMSGSGGRSDGLDHLLRAAETLGWRRVKEIVDGVLSAPA